MAGTGRILADDAGFNKREKGAAAQRRQIRQGGRKLLNLPNVVGFKKFHEVMVLLPFLHIFYLLMDSVVVGRSLDIADNSKSNGKSMLIVHHGKLQL